MNDLTLTMNIGDTFRIETNNEVLYLKVSKVGSYGDNISLGIATNLELQATDENNKIHILEIYKVDKLEKGWKPSDWFRLKTSSEIIKHER